MSVCTRVLDEGPGTARRSRPVPFRSVEYRAARHPLSTAVSASTPARLPASVPPHAEPFALRSDQGALLCLPAGHPARIRSLSRRLIVGAPLHPRHPRPSPSHLSLFLSSLFFFSRSTLRSSLSLLKISPSPRGFSLHPTLSHRGTLFALLSGSRVTLGERTSTGYRPLRLPSPPAHSPSRSPSRVSFILTPSPSTQPVCLSLSLSDVFSLPPSCPPPRSSTLPPRSARDAAVFVSPRQAAVLFLRRRLLSRSSVSFLSLSLGSNAGVYSRCHLIAGRFSRVRYRSATESTQSAGARSCSGSSFSLSFSLSLRPSILVLSFSPLLLPPHPRAAFHSLLFHRRSSSCSSSSSWSSYTRLVAARRQHRRAGGYPGGRREARKKKKRKAEHRSGRHRPTVRPGCGRSLASSSFHGSSPAESRSERGR